VVRNTRSEAVAQGNDANERHVSSTRLLENVNASRVDFEETIRLLEQKSIERCCLTPTASPTF